MVLFPHVLRICAIAIVFNNVHGYVFLAGNIDDFKSIANKFLSEDVARKLMDLVAKASGTDKDAGRQIPDDIEDKPVSKITTTEKEKLDVELNTTPANSELLEQSTKSIYDRKRYKTIGRSGDSDTTLKKLPSHIQTKKSADAANVREEYEKRLKQYLEDYTYNDDDKKHEETKSREPFNKFREERAEADARQVENKKTYDYTEAKLGEWNINQKPVQKPVDIQDGVGKSGYKITGVNMEKEDAINTHMVDTQYNVNIEQYKYLSSIKNHKAGNDYETNKDDFEEVLNDKLHDYHLSGPNNKMKNKNIVENMYVTNTRESNNKDSHIPLDDPKVKEREKYNDDKYVYGSQEKDISKIKPTANLRMENYTDELNSKYSNIDNSNERHIVENKDSHTRKPPKQYVVKDTLYEESEVGRKTENKKDRNDLKQHDIDEQDNWQTKGKDELYSKYDLGSKTKDSLELHRNKLKRIQPNPLTKTNERSDNEVPYTKTYNIKKPEITKQKDNEVRLRKKPVETNDMFDKYILGSKNGDSEEQLPEHKDNNKAKPMKQAIEDGMYKYLLGEPEQSKSIYTLKTTTSDKEDREERKRKPVKPVEQNDSYEKFILGSIDSKEHQVSKQEPPKNKQRLQIENDRKKDELDESKEKKHQRQGIENDKQPELGKSKERKPENDHVVPNDSRLRNKKRKKVIEFTAATEAPLPGFVDDPLPDFKEVKAEAIKARTESLIGDSDEMFTMKGTGMPTRKVFKMSSPDYYRQQPRIVDKYDFNEPLPEKDREREKKVYIKREPASVNRKVKLPLFDKL